MMSYKQWLVLLGIYVMFMMLGAVVFIYLEVGNEMSERRDLLALKAQVKEVLSGLDNETLVQVSQLVRSVGQQCSIDFLEATHDHPITWSLWNSFFFTFTVITTIGFGHMSPSTSWGRLFCIFYAFIGVPFNGILVASLSDLFSSKVVNSQVRKYAKRYQSWVGVAADTLLYLVPGMVVFLLVPSAVFAYVEEDWDYLDALYFSFITLTTIGFGDQVAGLQEKEQVWLWVYKIVMVVWIFFGLGYIIMIITFIQKALQSKQVLRVEKKLSSALKRKTNRLNTNVHRDVKRIRTALLTLGLARISPTYPDATDDTRTGKSRTWFRSLSSLEIKPSITSLPPANGLPHPTCQPKTTRSASQPHLGSVEELETVSNINILLDMVETIVQEHNAMAAEDMEDEMRHIVEDHHTPEDEDMESFAASTQKLPGAMESGHINHSFINDEGRVENIYDSSRSKDDTSSDHDSSLHDRLHSKLQLLFHGKYSRKASVMETMKNSAVRPFKEDGVFGTSPSVQHSSHTLPRRMKTNSGNILPPLSTIFMNPDSSCNGVRKSQNQVSSEQRSDNTSTPRSRSVSDSSSEARLRALESCQPAWNCFTHWRTYTETRRDQHLPQREHQDEDEEKGEYTRL